MVLLILFNKLVLSYCGFYPARQGDGIFLVGIFRTYISSRLKIHLGGVIQLLSVCELRENMSGEFLLMNEIAGLVFGYQLVQLGISLNTCRL